MFKVFVLYFALTPAGHFSVLQGSGLQVASFLGPLKIRNFPDITMVLVIKELKTTLSIKYIFKILLTNLISMHSLEKDPEAPRIQKAVKGMAKYFTDVEKIPLGVSDIDFLMINTPPYCNFSCIKCFTDAESRGAVEPLPLNDWLRIISEAKEMGAKNVSILGEGEPLIFEPIKKIISHIKGEDMIPMIATNAHNLTPEMTDFLYQNNVTIGFSLDTLDAKEYQEFCRGDADFGILMDNISYARKRFSDTLETKNGFKLYRLVLHMTATPQNFHWFRKLRDFCGDDIYFDVQPLANVGVAEKYGDNFSQEEEALEESYEQFQKYGHRAYPPMVLAETDDKQPTCCLFYYGLAINHSGEIMFDTHAIEPKNAIGSARELPLQELNMRVKKLRKYFLENFEAGYCPVRDEAYKKFLELTKSDINKIICL